MAGITITTKFNIQDLVFIVGKEYHDGSEMIDEKGVPRSPRPGFYHCIRQANVDCVSTNTLKTDGITRTFISYSFGIGKEFSECNVFATREEAEAELKRREAGK